MQSVNNINKALEKALDMGKKAGASACEVVFASGTNESVSIREGDVDGIDRAETSALGMRLFVGKKNALVSTSDLSDQAISSAIEKGVAIAKEMPEDPYAGLAEKSDLATEFKDFDLVDDKEFGPQEMKDWCLEAEEAAMADQRVTASRGAGFSKSSSKTILATSHGFWGESVSTSFGGGLSIVASENGQSSTSYQSTSAAHFSDIKAPLTIGNLAKKEACDGLNAVQISSEHLPVLIDREAAGSLLGHFLGMINGDAVSMGTTLLKDAMGEAVFSPDVTIVDDPHRMRHMGSASFDDEGLPTQKCTFVENGILKSWILDLKRARKLGLKSTAHGSRGLSSPPSPQSHAPYLAAGERSPEEMMASMEKGVFITGFMGSTVSLMTGDYSRGFMGFLVENGKKKHALKEVTLSGNLKDIFANIVPASDLIFEHRMNTPSLFLPKPMSISGA